MLSLRWSGVRTTIFPSLITENYSKLSGNSKQHSKANIMSKNFFIKFVTSPDVDPLKCLVGLGCAAQAVNDGHKVDIFFAAAAVQMLHTEYLSKLDKSIDAPAGISQSFFETIKKGANGIHCSTQSQAHFGVSQDSSEALIDGVNLNWSGPPGVIALAANADVTMMY